MGINGTEIWGIPGLEALNPPYFARETGPFFAPLNFEKENEYGAQANENFATEKS